MGDKPQEPNKKCFCARCFLPITAEDKVDIEGQNFHKFCSMCCICRTIPTSLKMFYGHVFCADCFKTHVMNKFKGESPRMYSNSWWMQWAPGNKPNQTEQDSSQKPPEDLPKRCICARCLCAIDESNKVEIGGQNFHSQCAKCYFCHTVPTNLKIYYGQVFCEDCFHRHVMNRNKDNPAEFFKHCFEQWQNNAAFADNMKEFMSSNSNCSPLMFMMGQPHPPFCRCGTGSENKEWCQGNNEPKKSVTRSIGDDEDTISTWELSFENRTEASYTFEAPESLNILEESAKENFTVTMTEKIEKLTRYLHEVDADNASFDNGKKKWQNFNDVDTKSMSEYGWVSLQSTKTSKYKELKCPPCLWQCGPIYVHKNYLQKEIGCETLC